MKKKNSRHFKAHLAGRQETIICKVGLVARGGGRGELGRLIIDPRLDLTIASWHGGSVMRNGWIQLGATSALETLQSGRVFFVVRDYLGEEDAYLPMSLKDM